MTIGVGFFAAAGYIFGGIFFGSPNVGALVGVSSWFVLGILKAIWIMGTLFWNFERPGKKMSRQDKEICIVAMLYFSLMNILTGPIPIYPTPV